MHLKHLTVAALFAAAYISGGAEVPSGYYSNASGKSGSALLQALYNTVSSHTNVGYDGLLTLYKTSDVRANGTIWDMYSTKEWTYGNTCGNYSYVGDCYNREHSVPQSWFGSANPMKSDAFHVYPTDGKVNGQRSNYPYGECANGTYLASHSGVQPLGRLGASTFSGYSGTVFEPDDEYKGDFARSYFYMAAAYYDRIASWDSPSFAGNNYPTFSTWTLNLLLKWHRQDPVSQKELDRNEVVYAHQKNRNPFIDYPELAEHVWGNKTSVAWSPDANADPEIVQPAESSTLDFGVSSLNHTLSKSVTVRTVNASANVSVAVSGTGFSASTSSLSYSSTNASNGTSLTLNFTPSAEGTYSGTLTLTCGSLSRTMALSGRGVDGLSAGPATYVTDESFVATWVYIGDDNNGNYTLDVYTSSSAVEGYPRQVPAAAGKYTVEGLEPSTTYYYTVASAQMESDPVSVTTADPMPSIEFLFDGRLYFTAAPGEPSEVAELLMEVDNIYDDVTVTVGSPFEVSADRSSWARTVTVDPDQGQLYLRMYAQQEGSYTATMRAVSGSYTSEEITLEGIATNSADFLETFEGDATGFGSYTPTQEYCGTAARWNFSDTGLWSSDAAHNGTYAPRFGKSSSSYIEMAEDRTAGIGKVSFYAKYWGSESNPVIDVQVSTDGGQSYTSAGSVTVTSGSDYDEYSVFVGQAGKCRLRLQQTSGGRLNIDDVAITRFSTGVSDLESARHGWDAHSCAGGLMVELTRATKLGVYALDGTVLHLGVLQPGSYTFDVAPGLYIVASDDFARRVVIR